MTRLLAGLENDRYPEIESNEVSVVRVLFFAACRERTGVSADELDVGGRSVSESVRAIVAKYPSLSAIAPRCRVAVNQTFVEASDVVPDGAELVLVPPVAGG